MAVLNRYKTEFFCECPINNIRIHYFVEIETEEIIAVEELIDYINEHYKSGWHEHIADDLHTKFGGTQTMRADHHSVTITTHRS